MTPSRRFSKLIPALAVAALLATPAFAQDKAKPAAAPEKAKAAAPAKADEKGQEQVKVLVENDKVRVSETHYKPGAASAMRERGARVTRALVGGTMERSYPDGKKETVVWKAGDVKYFPKETFMNKNVGKNEVVLYVVTLK
jgi:hypothetical protein